MLTVAKQPTMSFLQTCDVAKALTSQSQLLLKQDNE